MGILNFNGILHLFFDVLKTSALSGAGILLLLAFSPLLEKKHTVFWRYLLWVVLAIRLALPFDISISGQAVTIPVPVEVRTEEQKSSVIHSEQTENVPDKSAGNIKEEEQQQQAEAFEAAGSQKDRTFVSYPILQWAAVLWAAGVIVLFVWQFVCYSSFCRNLEKTKSYFTKKEGLFVYTSPAIGSPMLIGIKKPQILLSCGEYHKEQLEFILEHEFAHYKRKDLWIKLLLAVARTIHWFNPLVALMERQAAKDMELLCDSYVVRNLTKEEKKRYSETLLACAASGGSRPHILCTSEFSKDGNILKKRFANIFSGGRKRGLLAAVFGIGILLAVSLFVAFGPSEEGLDGNPAKEAKGGADTENPNEQIRIEAALKEELSKLSGAVEDMEKAISDSSNLRTGDLRSVVGKEYLYEDEEGWSYYLEEDENKESPLQDVAGALEPLLLTRYKGEERQILESLMYQDTWKECPVLFSEGRIIYKAAPTADIIGVKDPVLVSIAMDGSDRKTADTILYHTFDGLCEDGGWIYYSGWTNDNEFPKPLCRISPDFTGGPQYVEDIPGLLCGVMDGYVFYMAAKGKKPGIWKRELSTGKEQIHDKWGESAEKFCYFNAREKRFPAGELREEEISGCHILFGYDYEDELYTSDVPFYID